MLKLETIKNKEFDHLFRTYYAPMLLYAKNVLGSNAQAEDVVQESFCQLLHADKNIKDYKYIKAYLFKILHNKIIDTLRYNDRHKFDRINEILQENTIEDNFVEIEIYALLYKEINLLPIKNSSVLKLKLQGKKDKEIAQILNIKYETVRSHVKNAIKTLRKRIKYVLLIINILS